VGNLTSWMLLIIGVLCVIAELVLGAVTGFDLALVGGSLALGGIVGLFAHSETIGVISAAILALAYFLFIRSWVKSKLQVQDRASNVDAVVGKPGVVTKRIAPRDCGLVKVGSEEWRAELMPADPSPREIGTDVLVVSVEGVTLKVR
jgi:membrane protein implicated in regulation of membrane protease activity